MNSLNKRTFKISSYLSFFGIAVCFVFCLATFTTMEVFADTDGNKAIESVKLQNQMGDAISEQKIGTLGFMTINLLISESISDNQLTITVPNYIDFTLSEATITNEAGENVGEVKISDHILTINLNQSIPLGTKLIVNNIHYLLNETTLQGQTEFIFSEDVSN